MVVEMLLIQPIVLVEKKADAERDIRTLSCQRKYLNTNVKKRRKFVLVVEVLENQRRKETW